LNNLVHGGVFVGFYSGLFHRNNADLLLPP